MVGLYDILWDLSLIFATVVHQAFSFIDTCTCQWIKVTTRSDVYTHPRPSEFSPPRHLIWKHLSCDGSMGKNKNKAFDLAKRQEKILKRMAKPLYKKSEESMYFV